MVKSICLVCKSENVDTVVSWRPFKMICHVCKEATAHDADNITANR